MEDIPQPAESPYAPGDTVRVYVGESDPDSGFHGAECVVTDRFEDSLGDETGRELDRFTYRVRRVDNSERIGVDFRHWDLVPVE